MKQKLQFKDVYKCLSYLTLFIIFSKQLNLLFFKYFIVENSNYFKFEKVKI